MECVGIKPVRVLSVNKIGLKSFQYWKRKSDAYLDNLRVRKGIVKTSNWDNVKNIGGTHLPDEPNFVPLDGNRDLAPQSKSTLAVFSPIWMPKVFLFSYLCLYTNG